MIDIENFTCLLAFFKTCFLTGGKPSEYTYQLFSLYITVNSGVVGQAHRLPQPGTGASSRSPAASGQVGEVGWGMNLGDGVWNALNENYMLRVSRPPWETVSK